MAPKNPDPQLSVLVPCCNEADCVQPFLDEIYPTLEGVKLTWEILFIDDGSTDNTVETIDQAHQRDSRIRGVAFSRNFGKEAAITCGLHYSEGNAVIIMDADLQHPPKIIGEMVRLWQEEGYDMVVPLNQTRSDENIVKRHLTRLYYRLLSLISTVPIPCGASDFRLLDRKVVEAIKKLPRRG